MSADGRYMVHAQTGVEPTDTDDDGGDGLMVVVVAMMMMMMMLMMMMSQERRKPLLIRPIFERKRLKVACIMYSLQKVETVSWYTNNFVVYE